MKRRLFLIILLVVLIVANFAVVVFADGGKPLLLDPDPCTGELPPFGDQGAACQFQLSEVAPAGPWGPNP